MIYLQLEAVSKNMLNWFMKANPNKYHFLTTDKEAREINIGHLKIKSTKSEKLSWGITIDNNLSFEQRVNNICKKVDTAQNHFLSQHLRYGH